MNTFIEARLLDQVSYGSEFGREFNTRIVQLRSGRERRNADWSAPLGRYSLAYDVIKPDDHHLVIGAHTACMGSLIGFRFKDWADYRAWDEPLTTGTGAQQSVQLKKAYTFGPLTYEREIFKPVDGAVTIYADGIEIASVVSDTTGIAVFTAPNGSAVTWTGEFDVPVRFASDRLDVQPITEQGRGFLLTADVDVVEVRL